MTNKVRLQPFKVQEVITNTSEYIPPGVQMIHAPDQWEKGNEGEGVIVAVIDTGVDYNHPDLKENIIGGKDFTGKGDFLDGNGHATHVAGTIAASNSGSGIVGVAPKAKILALKALRDDGSGDIEAVIEAIRYATQYGVDVINMSLGGPNYPELHEAVKEAVDKGIIVCAAAGNEGDGNPRTEEMSYPGAYSEVIEVGAVDYNGQLAYFSNTNHEVDILAPGVQVLSTYLNGQYAKLDGTSMATPHMAGAVALLKSNNTSDYRKKGFILDVSTKVPNLTPNPNPNHKSKPKGGVDEDYIRKLKHLLQKILGGKKQ